MKYWKTILAGNPEDINAPAVLYIEKSAYDQLKKERDELESMSVQMKRPLLAEITQLQSDRQVLLEALKRICETDLENNCNTMLEQMGHLSGLAISFRHTAREAISKVNAGK